MKSMTGFAAASGARKGFSIAVEIQSYNHRFLDIRVKLPNEFQVAEQAVIRETSARLVRGRVNILVNFRRQAGYGTVKINEELARKYYLAWKKLRSFLHLKGEIEPKTLMEIPGIFYFSPGRVAPRTFKNCLAGALRIALKELVETRQKEGEHLRINLRKHLTALGKNLRVIDNR
ncbi:MAG: YicC/YloC family endoribonuclease, partial [Elusimicrobiota bacterium]|nr:YicC/YloC family endoribonuclease [Elusimicrobiota bacterium]